MKKILLVLFALFLVIGFAACGEGSGAGDGANVLRMGTNADFPPFEFWEDGEIVGLDPDLARAIGDILGYEIEIIDMDFDAIILSVQQGQVDFGMAGMTIRDDRREFVDFTQGYFNASQRVIVRDDSAITSIADLTGVRIGAQLGTTGALFVEDNMDAELFNYQTGSDAVLALLAGDIDAVVIDGEPARHFAAVNAGLSLLADELTSEYYGIALAHDSPLTARFDDALNQLRANGVLYEIIDRWINVD